MKSMCKITFGIITVSDTCFAKANVDRSGPALEADILSHYPNASIIAKQIVPDDKKQIEDELRHLCKRKCNVILTTGGTGFSPRDVTPEATKAVIEREAPGVVHAMTAKSLQVTDMAMLSRAVCGIVDTSLIINLPGSVKGATECFGVVASAIPHAVALLTQDRDSIATTHVGMQILMESSKVKTNNVANRDRSSPYPMVEVKDALEKIRITCTREGCEETETIDIDSSLNRILAENVVSVEPFPPFPASIKDGYAVISADGSGQRRVRDAVAAGDDLMNRPLEAGEVIRISTGAAVPKGADAVVEVENTELVEASDGREIIVDIKVAPKLGQDIRPVGSDLQANAVVLNKYDKISPAHIGILATIGKIFVRVYKRPLIGILSTGNELQKYDEQLRPGHIRDSNKLALLNLLRQHGYQADDCGIAKDEADCVKSSLANAMSKHDFVITTGGVSMSEFDLVKEVLKQDFNAEIIFGRVNMKPGKPTTFAICMYQGKRKVIFGLPGNPVSAIVTTILFVVPALRFMESSREKSFPVVPIIMTETVKLDMRPDYRRVKVKRSEDQLSLVGYSTGDQLSCKLNSCVGASAIAMLPGRIPGRLEEIKAGETVQAYLIDLTYNL